MSNRNNVIANPIMGSQVIDVNIQDDKCLDLQCHDLPSVLQKIIDILCDNVLPETFTNCVGTYTTLPETITGLANKICEIDERTVDINPITTVNVNMCLSDSWDFDDNESCLGSTSTCGLDIDNVVQILVSRVLSYQSKIIELNDKIISLETSLNTIQTQINTIQNTCC